MPKYDYHCETNGRTVEVMHRMSETITTWGELCARAGIAPEDTPAEAPVGRIITSANLARRDNLGCDTGPPIEDCRHKGGNFWQA